MDLKATHYKAQWVFRTQIGKRRHIICKSHITHVDKSAWPNNGRVLTYHHHRWTKRFRVL